MQRELKDRTEAKEILGLPHYKPKIKPDTGDDHGERLTIPLRRHTERHRPPPHTGRPRSACELYGLATAAPGEGVLPALAGTSMRYPADYHKRTQEPPPLSTNNRIQACRSTLHAYSPWTSPTLPLNTPAVTKDIYEFMAEDQQVAREKYVSLLASNLEKADLLHTADMLSALASNTAAAAIIRSRCTFRSCCPGQPVLMPRGSLRPRTQTSPWRNSAPLC